MTRSWTTPRSALESSVTTSSMVFQEVRPGSRFCRSARQGRARCCNRPHQTTAHQYPTTAFSNRFRTTADSAAGSLGRFEPIASRVDDVDRLDEDGRKIGGAHGFV